VSGASILGYPVNEKGVRFMRNIAKKKKKGLTLIEILISLTILAIIVIPISNLVLSSVKLNKSGEDKQKAVTIAQQIIEELKAAPKLESSMELSNGLTLTAIEGSTDSYQGTKLINNEFTAAVTVSPKTGSGAVSQPTSTLSYDADILIGGNDSTGLTAQFKEDIIPYNIKWDSVRIENKTDKIYITLETTAGSTVTKSYTRTNNAVRIQFGEKTSFTGSNVLAVKASNSLSGSFSVYFEENSSAKIKYTLENLAGQIRKYNTTVYTAAQAAMERAYEIQINVSKRGSMIYTAKAFKTMF
jgi:prepilin-type N-terminal cleavage/methylation domain-containing protein